MADNIIAIIFISGSDVLVSFFLESQPSFASQLIFILFDVSLEVKWRQRAAAEMILEN